MADPRQILHGRDVTERAAAARELARIGDGSDVEALVAIAIGDKSPSLRLYAAAAAANILHRLRLQEGELPRELHEQVQAWLKPVDPGINPSVLQLYSASPDRSTVDRLCRLLRDLRNGVREAALVALSRMAKSASAPGPERFERPVRAALDHPKLQADVALGLVNLAGEVGWVGLTEAIKARAVSGRLLPEAIELALQRFSRREAPRGWEGLWISRGLDVGLEGEPSAPEPLVIHQGQLSDAAGARPLTLGEGGARADGYGEIRMIWARQVGAEDLQQAIQAGQTTWWRAVDKELPKSAEEVLEKLHGPGAEAVSDWLAEAEGARAPRLRAILLHRAGQHERALELLQPMVETRKPRNDLHYWHGSVLASLDRPDEARSALARFLDGAGKKAKWRKEAEALLSSLG